VAKPRGLGLGGCQVHSSNAAGLFIVGKTNVPEFTLEGYTGNPIHGVTNNPWVLILTPGGVERRQRRCRGSRSRAIAGCRCPAGPSYSSSRLLFGAGDVHGGFRHDRHDDPAVTALGYDPIWRGVIVTILIEIAMVRPPDGTIMYVLQGMRRTPRPIIDVFAGVMQSVSTCLRS
jgi:Amidase